MNGSLDSSKRSSIGPAAPQRRSTVNRRWQAGVVAIVTMAWCLPAPAATVRTSAYGTTKDGRAVTAYTLVNDAGASATILDYGATIAAIRVPDRDGTLGNTVLSFADMSGWEALAHANAILGRVANRITNGFTLDGVRYPLKPGPNGTTMHSATGYTGYGVRTWKVAPVRARDGAAITMTLDSPDGDQGMPGHVVITATYRFTNANALRLDMTATTDKATPINLTNHVYFNLSGNSVVPVLDHELQVMSDRIASAPGRDPLGGQPLGQLLPVVGTPYDFYTRPVVLRDRIGAALGPEYLTAATSPPLPPTMIRNFDLPFSARNGLDRVAARLHDPKSGRVLEVRTVEPSAHIFASARVRGDYLSDVGKPFTPFPAVAIETQHLPDSPNLPQFPSVILRPGKTFRSTTIYAFTTDRTPAGR